MFRTLLAKELLEQRRTSKLIIFLAVFFIVGCISPVFAKYTPALLSSIPNVPPDFAKLFPEPSIKDSFDQYSKNTMQFGVLLVILMTMGVIAQEKEHGTAAMLFTKPVRRSAVVLSKWLAGMVTIAISVVVGGIGCAVYTLILFKALPIGGFLIFNLLLLIFLAVYLSVAILASAISRTQSMAAACAFGGLAILLILSSLPRLSEYFPPRLLSWGTSILGGSSNTAWPALVITVGLIVISVACACFYLERQEI